MEMETYLGRPVKSIDVVTENGTFSSYYKAERILNEKGYICGSMCRDMPIGFANKEKYGYIGKWYNLSKKDISKLEGVMISDDFREGSVKIITFKS